MASKESAVRLESGEWKILYKDSKGNERTRDTVAEIEKMDDAEALQVFQGLVKEAPNKRRAAVSVLCAVMQGHLADLSAWQGKGNKKTGLLSNELKDEFRKAEDGYFGQFMKKDHPAHKTFVGRLPKINERGDAIEEEGTENIKARFNYFVTMTRKDPSYAAAKNLVLSFFAFVGNLPYDDNGHIVPPEVMRVMVQNAKDITPPDNSYRARLNAIIRELTLPDNPEKPVVIADEDLPGLVQNAKNLLGELERLATLAAQRATQRAKPGDVVEQTQAAMKEASGKREATPPSGAAVKEALM